MKKRLLLLFCLAAGCLHAEVKVSNLELKGGDEVSRKAYMAQPIRIWGSSGYFPDPLERVNLITLSNAKSSFTLNLNGKVDPQGKLNGKLGMLRPSSANWYANEFFSFDVNGMTPADTTVEITKLDSGTEKGSVTLLYSGKDFTAVLTVTLADNDDKLMLEFKPECRDATQKTYGVSFLCYPSSLAGGWQAGLKLRKREALTPLRTLPESGKYVSLENNEPWILFYDLHFDVKNNRGEGPCALMFSPKECVRKEVLVGNYSCVLKFRYSMNTASQFILWDFCKWSNESALNYLKALDIQY